MDENARSASKASCHGLARVMTNGHVDQGIRVKCVVPGFIDRAVNAAVFEDQTVLAADSEGLPMR